MGYVQAYSDCFGCKRPFFYNPQLVPSLTVNGTREPVCRDCVERVNPMRVANGLEPITPHPHAYEPLDESAL